MPSTNDLTGVDKVLRKLKEKTKLEPQVIAYTGYQASYAIHVHENLNAKHAPGKMAKYLERPARRLMKELGQMVVDAVKKGMSVANALLRAGLRLQRESQQVVPVDTGFLRSTAFTELEKK